MAAQIHPTAMVSSSSILDEGVVIGAYAIIGENVKIGASTVIDAFAQVLGYTEIGRDCHIFSNAMVGSMPQDLKYKGERSFLIIGDNNQIREFVTINPGTDKDSKTVIGNNNLFMVYSHVAHDCCIGNNNILANASTLAGYVTIGDRVVLGGLVAVHQFCRIGDLAIIGGCSKVVQDIPPYSMCDGHPALVCGLNLVGLRRAKFSSEIITALKKAYKILFFENHSLAEAKKAINKEIPPLKEIDFLLQFALSSKRGIGRKK